MSEWPEPPLLSYAFEAIIKLDPILDLGNTPVGHRRIINIVGGDVRGPRLTGTVLPGGADWQFMAADRTAHVEARYTLKTENGDLIYVQNTGYRHGPKDVIEKLAQGQEVDPSLYYFRTTPVFETASAEYEWLNRTIFVGVGARFPDNVTIKFFSLS